MTRAPIALDSCREAETPAAQPMRFHLSQYASLGSVPGYTGQPIHAQLPLKARIVLATSPTCGRDGYPKSEKRASISNIKRPGIGKPRAHSLYFFQS